MADPTAVEALRRSVAVMQEQAEEAIREAEQTRIATVAFSEQLEALVSSLPTQRCMFCNGHMIDTSSLTALAEHLAKQQQYLHQGEKFTLHCLDCGVYQASEPRGTAQRWAPETIDGRSTVFAAEIFNQFPEVAEVALEQAAGRGWMIKYKMTWFAAQADKSTLREAWHMNRP